MGAVLTFENYRRAQRIDFWQPPLRLWRGWRVGAEQEREISFAVDRVKLAPSLCCYLQVDSGSTFALRRSTLDFCLGGQRSYGGQRSRASGQAQAVNCQIPVGLVLPGRGCLLVQTSLSLYHSQA